MNGASPQDFTVVSNQLAILQSSYEALQTQVTETCQKLSFKLVKVKREPFSKINVIVHCVIFCLLRLLDTGVIRCQLCVVCRFELV